MYSICMKGNIYTSQKCPSCGGKMLHNDRKSNCFCIVCGIPASKGYMVRFGREICKRFSSYAEAAQFLSGLRFKTAEGSYDRRDYQKENPLSFGQQSEKWLGVKEQQVGGETYRKYARIVRYANSAWKDRNVKTISFGDLQDFLYSARFKSDKYRHDARSCLNHFFDWLVDREDIKKPKIPAVSYELGWRTITDLDTQHTIITELKRIAPAKVAFGVELLATYIALRPDDLRRVAERDIAGDIMTIRKPTKLKNRQKIIRLIPEHVDRVAELLNSTPTPLPHLPFFRHTSRSGVAAETPYGKDLFYSWWIKACNNLGIEGLDMYGGTRHSTTTAIAEMTDEATAKQASGHLTNKAFDRYCQADNKAAFEMAQIVHRRTATDQQVINIKRNKEIR